MRTVSGVHHRSVATVLLLLLGLCPLGTLPSLASARDVPLHHKSSLLKSIAPAETVPELGQGISEDLPASDFYDDYEAAVDEENSSATPPDVIYPNPDRLLRKQKQQQTERSGEIKSSNFVLRGLSTKAAPNPPPPQQPPPPPPLITNVHNNRVLVRPNDAPTNDEDGDYVVVVDPPLDQDFKGHDLIDSIMYIYYGANSGSALGKEVGGNIIVIGAVVALAAQLLTIAILFMKRGHRSKDKLQSQGGLFPVLTILLVFSFLANFCFVVGVQSSGNVVRCEAVAIVLHYLHLSTTFWVFLYIYSVHEFIKNDVAPNLKVLLCVGLVLPALYIAFNYLMATSNYEVTNYCWMSVTKGMIFNYMIPISFFIVATAVYGTLCLRLLRIRQRQQFTESIESFIEHSRSEQMLNQIRQLGPECPQQGLPLPPPTAALASSHPPERERSLGGSHRRLARCHSNPSSSTLKKSTAHLRAAANLTNSSINLTSTATSQAIGSPTGTAPQGPEMGQALGNGHGHERPHLPPCCSAMMLSQSQQNVMLSQTMSPPCMEMMGKSICGDSKYSLGSISLANLSIQSLSSETEDFEEYKTAVKFSILFQIMFSIIWFLAVIGLEYSTSMMPVVYVIVLNIVYWILLAKCQAICPTMALSPLTGVPGAGEGQSCSFRKKSTKSVRSVAGDQQQQQHQQLGHHMPTSATVPSMTAEKGDRMNSEGGIGISGRDRNGSLRSNSNKEEEKSIKSPFVEDQLPGVGGVGDKKKKESVSSVDTIPLLAKSAGLRTDTKATIIDNGEAMVEPLENGLAETTDVKMSSQILGNGHASMNLWSSSAKGQNGLDAITHRTEFISTISS